MYPKDWDWVSSIGEVPSLKINELEKRIEKLENKKSDSNIVFDFGHEFTREHGPKTTGELLKTCAVILLTGSVTTILIGLFFRYIIG